MREITTTSNNFFGSALGAGRVVSQYGDFQSWMCWSHGLYAGFFLELAVTCGYVHQKHAFHTQETSNVVQTSESQFSFYESLLLALFSSAELLGHESQPCSLHGCHAICMGTSQAKNWQPRMLPVSDKEVIHFSVSNEITSKQPSIHVLHII